jgi:hypothetical protein
MILTDATDPDGYVNSVSGWQRDAVAALRDVVRRTAPAFDERLKWGHLLYAANGPAVLVRAEPSRVLFGFFRGRRLLHIESRLRGGGKYELASLELRPGTPLARETACQLVAAALDLDRQLGDPTDA